MLRVGVVRISSTPTQKLLPIVFSNRVTQAIQKKFKGSHVPYPEYGQTKMNSAIFLEVYFLFLLLFFFCLIIHCLVFLKTIQVFCFYIMSFDFVFYEICVWVWKCESLHLSVFLVFFFGSYFCLFCCILVCFFLSLLFLDVCLILNERQKRCGFAWLERQKGFERSLGRENCNQNSLQGKIYFQYNSEK